MNDLKINPSIITCDSVGTRTTNLVGSTEHKLNESCRGSSSDTTANKINPYYLIGLIFLYIFIFLY